MIATLSKRREEPLVVEGECCLVRGTMLGSMEDIFLLGVQRSDRWKKGENKSKRERERDVNFQQFFLGYYRWFFF